MRQESEVRTIATKTRNLGPISKDALLSVVERSLEDDLAEDVRIIPLAGKSEIADFIVIASGRSARKVGAIAEHLITRLKTAGVPGIHVEGQAHADWVLVDAGDVIVHLFRPDVRAYYDLEKLWEAELVPDARKQPALA